MPDDLSEWLLYSVKERGWGDTVLWWRDKASGYSRFIEEAGRYSLKEAESYVNGAGYCVVMVKAAEAWAAAKRVVRIQDLAGAEENYVKAERSRS